MRQYDLYLNQPSKIELFVSFGEEFKLKYCIKSPITTIFRYCGAGTVRFVRARKIADFYQIKRKNSQK
jgi:hypothetical protein